jgi:hypothetical protein
MMQSRWWWGLLLVALMQQTARANDCCHFVQSACVARPTHFLPDCKAGTEIDQDCDTLCCVENFLTDPCPGFIGPTCVANLTDAQCADTDGDGIIDDWEINGHDFNGNGTLDPGENLPALGANPQRKDVFVEADCMVASDHSHCPNSLALFDVVKAYANAPVQNVDGTLGVQLHVDTGGLYGAGIVTPVGRTGTAGAVGNFGDMGGGGSQIAEAGNTIVNYSGSGGATNFYTLKTANYEDDRRFLYRYMIFLHQTNARKAANDCTSGHAESIPGNDFFVSLGGTDAGGFACWGTDANGFSVGSRSQQAGTFMHELGHTLGLDHGGNEGTNNKPNYLSVMSYADQDCQVPPVPALGFLGGCDYSRLGDQQSGGPNDILENVIDECVGLGPVLALGPYDFNHDGKIQGDTCIPPSPNIGADVNNDGVCITDGPDGKLETILKGDDRFGDNDTETDGYNRVCESTAGGDDVQAFNVGDVPDQQNLLKSFNDWGNLVYVFQTLSSFSNGVSSPPREESDPQRVLQSRQYLSQLSLPSLTLTEQAPATILPGQTVTFTLSMQSVGHGPAMSTQIANTLPDGSQASFDVGVIAVGTTAMRTFQYRVPTNACPMNLVDTSKVKWIDLVSEPYSGSASATTRVLDVVAPTLSVSVSPSVLWPANHMLVPITATITVSDNCDPHPTVRLISVVSSEPDNGLGDGDTPNDIQGVSVGTDDRQFKLRAERSAQGSGRTYTITYQATDASGNSTRKQVTVFVPMSQ